MLVVFFMISIVYLAHLAHARLPFLFQDCYSGVSMYHILFTRLLMDLCPSPSWYFKWCCYEHETAKSRRVLAFFSSFEFISRSIVAGSYGELIHSW